MSTPDPKSEEDLTTDKNKSVTENLIDVSVVIPAETEKDTSEQVPGEESQQSPDIALSLQNTLRYSDVEGEVKEQEDSSSESNSSSSTNSDSAEDKFEDAPAMHEQSQFKNSFYEKLSVTCQNLESTVASLKKPEKSEDKKRTSSSSSSSTEIREENISQSIPESMQDINNVGRPETLSLSQPGSFCAEKHKKVSEKSSEIMNQQSLSIDIESQLGDEKEPQGAYYIEPSSNLSPNLLQGTVVRKGERIEFVADNLVEKIKQSISPVTHTDSTGSLESRRSSVRSIASASSSTSFATSSGVSHSPSSLLQQSPDDIPPIDAGAVLDLENHARRVADSLDLMMGNIRNNLHKMSAITIGCQDAYKRSVDITCDSVDGSIKTMYALMAKCEELSISMKPVDQLAAQIKEIKRILDLFELQLTEK